MKKYHQLTREERMEVFKLQQSELTITEIVEAMKRSKSTVSRELRRNKSYSGLYLPETAHIKAQKETETRSDVGQRSQASKVCAGEIRRILVP